MKQIFDKVEQAWRFTPQQYPSLPHVWTDHAKVAYSGHVLLHLMKQAGKLAALFEPMAHNPMPSMESKRAAVADQVAKTIVDAVRLAQLAGVSAEDVESSLNFYYTEWEGE